MGVQSFDETILIYGFALFFIFFVLMILIIRYSNKEIVSKLSHLYEKIKLTEKDMRKLAEVEMQGKKELKRELELLSGELEELKKLKEKQKATAR